MKYCNKDCLSCRHEKCIYEYSTEERQRILREARYKRYLAKNGGRKEYYRRYYQKRKAEQD